MTKRIYMVLIALLFIGVATAGVVSLSKPTKVSFAPSTPKASIHELGIFTFECGGKAGIVNGTEPYGKWSKKEIYDLIRISCTVEEITEIYDKYGNLYQKNKYNFSSFDENELKSDECQRDGNYWNSTLNVCDDTPPTSISP